MTWLSKHTVEAKPIFHDGMPGEKEYTPCLSMTNAELNHSFQSVGHTGLRQCFPFPPLPVCQVERLNVPPEKPLTAKTDGHETQLYLPRSVQPFLSLPLALPVLAG